MGTAADMIRRAFVLATVIGDDETPTAQQATDALADMNDMLAAWSIRGVPCGGPYALTDALAAPDPFMRAIRFNVACEIAPSYGIKASSVMVGAQSLAAIAQAEYADLKARLAQAVSMPCDPGLTLVSRGSAGRQGAYWGFPSFPT